MTEPCPQTPWTLAPVDDEVVEALAAATGLSRIVGAGPCRRAASPTPRRRERFLEPVLERDWLDPDADPGHAARRPSGRRTRSARASASSSSATSTSTASRPRRWPTRGLARDGRATSRAIVPHRFREGYGLSAAAIERVLALAPELVVTVDCGISAPTRSRCCASAASTSWSPTTTSRASGVPVGVPVADPKLDADVPVARPGRRGRRAQARAGGGRAARLSGRVARARRPRDARHGRRHRAACRREPRACRRRRRVDAARAARLHRRARARWRASRPQRSRATRSRSRSRPGSTRPAGWPIPQVALDLLLTDDPGEAEELALALDEHNRVRQAVEADLVAGGRRRWPSAPIAGERALVLAGEGWHEGVKGIVASRLTHALRRADASVLDRRRRRARVGALRRQVDLFQARRCVRRAAHAFRRARGGGGPRAARRRPRRASASCFSRTWTRCPPSSSWSETRRRRRGRARRGERRARRRARAARAVRAREPRGRCSPRAACS